MTQLSYFNKVKKEKKTFTLWFDLAYFTSQVMLMNMNLGKQQGYIECTRQTFEVGMGAEYLLEGYASFHSSAPTRVTWDQLMRVIHKGALLTLGWLRRSPLPPGSPPFFVFLYAISQKRAPPWLVSCKTLTFQLFNETLISQEMYNWEGKVSQSPEQLGIKGLIQGPSGKVW